MIRMGELLPPLTVRPIKCSRGALIMNADGTTIGLVASVKEAQRICDRFNERPAAGNAER